MPGDSSEYHIEKLRHPVSVVFTGGEAVVGDMFLAGRARYRSGTEQPLDVLNDGAPFFPLRVQEGQTILIAKGQVVVLEAEVPRDDEEPVAAAQSALEVQVLLANGTTRNGVLYPETSRERPRLLDFLNAYHAPFLPLYGMGRMYLINRQQIAHVRALT